MSDEEKKDALLGGNVFDLPSTRGRTNATRFEIATQTTETESGEPIALVKDGKLNWIDIIQKGNAALKGGLQERVEYLEKVKMISDQIEAIHAAAMTESDKAYLIEAISADAVQSMTKVGLEALWQERNRIDRAWEKYYVQMVETETRVMAMVDLLDEKLAVIEKRLGLLPPKAEE